MSVFLIGGNGLKPIGRETIAIYPGEVCYIGHSSSPDPVFVDSINDENRAGRKSAEKWVTFYRYPYSFKKMSRERLDIFRNLAERGTQTKLKERRRYLEMLEKQGHAAPDWLAPELDHLEKILSGTIGRVVERERIRMMRVEFAYRGEGDGWSIFERSHAHSISGAREDGNRTIYDSYDFNGEEAAQLFIEMAAGRYPGFEFVSSEPRED